MSEFNYKDFLKNSSFLNEAEEKEEDKVSEDRIEKAIKAVLKKEGGAAGLDPIKDAVKALDVDKDFDLEKTIKDIPSVGTHKDGDIIDTDGLKEEEEKLKVTESDAEYAKSLEKIARDKQLKMLSKKDKETLLKIADLMKKMKEGSINGTDGLKEEEENLEEAEESALSREKKMVMKLLLGKMQDIENANPEELTRDFLIKTKKMIDDLMISDF